MAQPPRIGNPDPAVQEFVKKYEARTKTETELYAATSYGHGAQTDDAVPVEHEGLYVAGVRRFCEAMMGRGEPAAPGDDGVRSLQTALAIAEACRRGTAVRIAPPG